MQKTAPTESKLKLTTENNIFRQKPVYEKILLHSGYGLLVLFYLSVVLSKAAVNISGALLILVSLIYFGIFLEKKKFFKKNRYLHFILLPVLLGTVLSLFSLDGLDAPYHFLNKYKFLVLFFPLSLFVQTRKQLLCLFGALILSAIAATGYGLYTTHAPCKLLSFHPPGRFANMLIVVTLIPLVGFFLISPSKRLHKISAKTIFLILTLFFICCLVFTWQRGSWVGFFFAIVIFSLFFRKKLIMLLLIGIIAFYMAPNDTRLKKEICSIPQIHDNRSNVVRWQLWHTGLDFLPNHLFFGTGSDNFIEPFRSFFHSQPKPYQKTYRYADQHPHLHNSYLQILGENGLIYFCLLFGSLFFLFGRIAREGRGMPAHDKKYVVLFIVATAGFFSAQMFRDGLVSYAFNAYSIALFGGCFVMQQSLDNRCGKDTDKPSSMEHSQ